jgi:hypothetical protein
MSHSTADPFITFPITTRLEQFPVPDTTALGELFCASLAEALVQHRGWRLDQVGLSAFERSTWDQDHFYELTFSMKHRNYGPLGQVLWSQPSSRPDNARLQRAGIPASASEKAVVGELARRFFKNNEQARIVVSLDFRPWAPDHLRYRLHYGTQSAGGPAHYNSLHAASFEALLIKVLEFLRLNSR